MSKVSNIHSYLIEFSKFMYTSTEILWNLSKFCSTIAPILMSSLSIVATVDNVSMAKWQSNKTLLLSIKKVTIRLAIKSLLHYFSKTIYMSSMQRPFFFFYQKSLRVDISTMKKRSRKLLYSFYSPSSFLGKSIRDLSKFQDSSKQIFYND